MTVFKLFPTYKMDGYDLILLRDTEFENDLRVKGNILCRNGRHSLIVKGDIKARNIDVRNITTNDIRANNIDAVDIDADDIDAADIIAYHILCDKRIKKTPDAKTIAMTLTLNRSELQFKERMPVEKK